MAHPFTGTLSAIKRNELQIHAATTQIQRNITLKKQDTSVSFHLHEMSCNPMETETITGH